MQFWYFCLLCYSCLSFYVLLSTDFPPNLETCLLLYCFCEILHSQSFVKNGFNRLHTPFMPADVFSSEDMLTFLRISNFLRIKMEICNKFDIAHYFTYLDLLNATEYKFSNWNIIS